MKLNWASWPCSPAFPSFPFGSSAPRWPGMPSGRRWRASRPKFLRSSPADSSARCAADRRIVRDDKLMIITNQTVALRRDCEAIAVPAGTRQILSAGTPVRITQAAGGSYTVAASGALYRIDEKDADALGERGPSAEGAAPPEFSEKMVWD